MLPGMGGEDEIEVMDGEGLEDYEQLNGQEQSPEQVAFIESLNKIHAQLTEPCQQQFQLAMQGKSMDDLTEECKLEFSTAAASIPEFAKQQEAAIQQVGCVVCVYMCVCVPMFVHAQGLTQSQ